MKLSIFSVILRTISSYALIKTHTFTHQGGNDKPGELPLYILVGMGSIFGRSREAMLWLAGLDSAFE